MWDDTIIVCVPAGTGEERLLCSVCWETKDAVLSFEKESFHLGMLEQDSSTDPGLQRGTFVQLLLRGEQEHVLQI